MDPDPDPGGPKTRGSGGSGSGFGSGSATLITSKKWIYLFQVKKAEPGAKIFVVSEGSGSMYRTLTVTSRFRDHRQEQFAAVTVIVDCHPD